MNKSKSEKYSIFRHDYKILGISHFRNCLIGQGYAVKISDFAMFRPAYSSDYFKTTENVKDIPTANAMAASSSQGDVIPLRWIPWEVYIMVRINISIAMITCP